MPRLDELGIPDDRGVPTPGPRDDPRDGRRYEMLDERPRAFTTVAVGLAIVLVIGLAVSQATLLLATPEGAAPNPSAPNVGSVQAFPEPRLQSAPAAELRDQVAAQRALLENWAWVDPAAGLARVPVERAARMYLEHGPAATRPDTRSGR
jgi:hypothetical protein